jgi:REP element-mobilizing transposase RayT
VKYDPTKHHRRSIRLKGYDYTAAGAYFITICTYQRECLFGEIVNGVMQLNTFGLCVQACWQSLPDHFQKLQLDAFVVMPNHLHGILLLDGDLGKGEAFGQNIRQSNPNFSPNASSLQDGNLGKGEAFGQNIRQSNPNFSPNASPLQPRGTQPRSVGAIIQNFKSVSTRKINRMHQRNGRTIWQRNYYEHIIRNESAFQTICQYIQNNPLSWELDKLHPDNPSK